MRHLAGDRAEIERGRADVGVGQRLGAGGFDHLKPLMVLKAAGFTDFAKVKYIGLDGGAEAITQTVEGRERYNVALRYPAALRQDPDAIAREELAASGLDRDVWQFPVVLLADVRSVGVQGDARTYGHPIVLRPVTSEDAMTADWARLPADLLEKISTRITNEVREINRVVVDVTSKPPGTIEWE